MFGDDAADQHADDLYENIQCLSPTNHYSMVVSGINEMIQGNIIRSAERGSSGALSIHLPCYATKCIHIFFSIATSSQLGNFGHFMHPLHILCGSSCLSIFLNPIFSKKGTA